MILIADGGSTKIDWAALQEGREPTYFKTHGVNPYFYGSERIVELITADLAPEIEEAPVTEVYFYGAGCSSARRNKRVHDALQQIWKSARIYVDHDLIGASKALCGDKPGIVAILGTGSNACLYNGNDVIDQHGGIGWILGDEASGAYLGKQLIQAMLYQELPEPVEKLFWEFCEDDINDIKDKIYFQPHGNRYLASFARFIKAHIDQPYLENLVAEGFRLFLDKHVIHFKNYTSYTFNSVGSIGFHLKPILIKVLEEYNITPGNIIQRPIEHLVAYHKTI